MNSSASSPFKLTQVKVRETSNLAPRAGSQWYARFMFINVDKQRNLDTMLDLLGVVGTVEIASAPWIEANKIGSTMRVLSIAATVDGVEFDDSIDYERVPTYEDALWFACRELNPMLESATTLFGIKHDIDIRVEHTLRPTALLLRNLTTPPPGHLKFKAKGRYTL
jgi:hypothetical protein